MMKCNNQVQDVCFLFSFFDGTVDDRKSTSERANERSYTRYVSARTRSSRPTEYKAERESHIDYPISNQRVGTLNQI